MSKIALPSSKDELNMDLNQDWPELFDQFADIALLLDSHGTIQRSNRTWHNLLQLQPDAAAQRLPLSYWLYSEDSLTFQCALMAGRPCKLALRLLIPEQPLVWFDLSLQPICAGAGKNQLRGWCILGTEQTQKIRQQELQDAQQRSLHDLLSRLPVMLYRSRNDWNWTMDYVSSGCQQITGYHSELLINTPRYGQLIHPDDQQYVWDSIQLAVQHHRVFHLHYRIITAQNSIQRVQEIGQGLYSQSDMVLGLEGAVFIQS